MYDGLPRLVFTHSFFLSSCSYSVKRYSYSYSKHPGSIEYEYRCGLNTKTQGIYKCKSQDVGKDKPSKASLVVMTVLENRLTINS